MSDTSDMSKDELRASMMGALWIICGIVLAALFISAAAQDGLTLAHIGITSIILFAAVSGTAFVWKAFAPADTHTEKAKRQRIDTMLRDMSDDELIELKKRLSDGDYSDDTILDFISDDGELVTRG